MDVTFSSRYFVLKNYIRITIVESGILINY